jgi:hypothetical protein
MVNMKYPEFTVKAEFLMSKFISLDTFDGKVTVKGGGFDAVICSPTILLSVLELKYSKNLDFKVIHSPFILGEEVYPFNLGERLTEESPGPDPETPTTNPAVEAIKEEYDPLDARSSRSPFSNTATYKDRIYRWNDRQFTVVDRETGEVKWVFRFGDIIRFFYDTPALPQEDMRVINNQGEWSVVRGDHCVDSLIFCLQNSREYMLKI